MALIGGIDTADGQVEDVNVTNKALHVLPVGLDGTAGTTGTQLNRYETTIGYASGLTGRVEFSQAENVRSYRLFPSANMRYVEDAQNATQAELLMNTAAAQSATIDESVDYSIARVAAAGIDGWTEWIELDKDPDLQSLSALWFGLDAAGTGATVFVETR